MAELDAISQSKLPIDEFIGKFNIEDHFGCAVAIFEACGILNLFFLLRIMAADLHDLLTHPCNWVCTPILK